MKKLIQAKSMKPNKTNPSEVAARCHEIQTGLGMTEVPEFDNLRAIGMAVRLALHIPGLPAVNYETLRLVANHFLEIPSVGLKRIMEILAEVEFVKLITQGKTHPTSPQSDGDESETHYRHSANRFANIRACCPSVELGKLSGREQNTRWRGELDER
jgi:hypothetical protein